ncbi:MAG: hypothetical protein LBR25_09985 [Erysipelotrichaceae bacterium]|jgi:hypothetical protein|nr:hypothetical protein [Erysipelotrichaceae bacterium]
MFPGLRPKVPWYAMILVMLVIGSMMLIVDVMCDYLVTLTGNDSIRILHILLLFVAYWLAGYFYPIFDSTCSKFLDSRLIAIAVFWLLIVIDRNLPQNVVTNQNTALLVVRPAIAMIARTYAGFAATFNDFYLLLFSHLPFGLGHFFDLFLLILMPSACMLVGIKATALRKKRLASVQVTIFGPGIHS